MRQLILLLAIGFWAMGLNAQDNVEGKEKAKISVKMDTRFDGVFTTFLGNGAYSNESGFVGRYLKLIVSGDINDKFSYNFRHRLYTNHNDPLSFFSATDWANVTYKINDKFSVTAGKQVVSIGTFEYDYAPIDVYFASHFWNNVNPFQIGVNFGYSPNKNHNIYAQIVNSPFSVKALEGIYAYNLIWYGNVNDWFSTIYSINFIEYQKGHFINYIALGNKFKFNGGEVDVDYMNRYAGKGTNFFSDFSVSSNVKFYLNDKFNLFAKGGYDINEAQDPADLIKYDKYVLPGVKGGFYGAGMEYFPIKGSKNLRVHAFVHSNSDSSIPLSFNLGVRWQIKVFER